MREKTGVYSYLTVCSAATGSGDQTVTTRAHAPVTGARAIRPPDSASVLRALKEVGTSPL